METNIKKASINGCLCFLLLSLLLGCNDDDPTPPILINSNDVEVSFDGVNNCQAAGGPVHTQFDFVIPYETLSDDIIIEKIVYSAAAGSSKAENEDYTFDDDGTTIEFGVCIRFTGAPGVDFYATLVATNGQRSNTAKVRIDKPAGAN